MPGLIAAVVLTTAIFLAACGGGDKEQASFNMTIGDLVPLTGYLSDFGPPGQRAADLADDQIQKAIDEAGADQAVTVKHSDDKTDARAAVRAARKLVDTDKATCLVGSWAPAATIRVAKTISISQKVLQISPASTSDEISDLQDLGLVNRTAPPDSSQGPVLADAIEVDLGGAQGKNVTIAARDDAYGMGIARSFGKAWRRKGGQITKTVTYGPQQRSYDSEARQIVSGSPDAYLVVDTVDTYQKVGPALVRTGRWNPRRAFAADGLASSDLPEKAGTEATEGMRGTFPGSPNTGTAAEAFDRLYTKASGASRWPFDAQTFDAVILCYLAAVAAGSADGIDVAAHLQAVSGPGGEKFTWEQLPDAVQALQDGDDIDYEGASGPIDLNDAGDPTAGTYDLFRYKDGKADVFDEVPFRQGAE